MTALVKAEANGGAPVRPEGTLADHIGPFLGWFATMRGRRPNTILAYDQDLRRFVAFAEGRGVRTPQAVTFQIVEMHMATLLQRGKQATTVNRQRFALDQFFRFLRRNGLADNNPVADVLPLREPKRLPRYLTIPEQERGLASLAESQSLAGRRDYALVATALFCGLRVEELTTLRLEDVDLDSGRLTVVGKGDKQRECPIVPRLAAILRDYLEHVRPRLTSVPIQGGLYRRRRRPSWYMHWGVNGEEFTASTGTPDEAEARAMLADRLRDLRREQASPYVFVNASANGGYTRCRAGAPLLTRSAYAIIRRRVSTLVGRPVHPHMLRHSFASRLRENGAPLELIQEALGHANLSTTLIYAHLTTTKQRQDIAKYLEGQG